MAQPETVQLQQPDFKWIDDIHQAEKLAAQVAEHPEDPVSVDTETTGLDIVRDSVILWSMYFHQAGYRYVLSRRCLEPFRPLFGDPERSWYFTNAKFDMHMLANSGMPEITGTVYDTMVLDWLLDENKEGLRDLDNCSWRHLRIRKTKFNARFKKMKGETQVEAFKRHLATQPQDVHDYASLDAWMTFWLAETLLQKLAAHRWRHLFDIYHDHLEPMIHVLWHMERRGTQLDIEYLQQLDSRYEQEMSQIQTRIYQIVGHEININSNPQLIQYFIHDRGMKAEKKTDGGAWKVDKSQLKIWASGGSEVAELILRYRKLAKLRGTYTKGLITRSRGGRIHTTFNLHITVSGRLSSSDPNLQNIPARDEEGHKIRRAFVASPGYKLIVADYGQLEMRIMAHFSRDDGMIDIIKSGKDIHSGTAALMFNVPYEDIVAAKKAKEPDARQRELVKMRSHSKNIGFGLIYGMGPKHLAEDLGIEVKEAKELIDKFFRPFQRIKAFIDFVHDYATEKGVVWTILKRPRRLPSAATLDPASRARALRQSVNSIIQGSAADITSSAMKKIFVDDRLQKMGCRMLIQIHDEIVCEVPEPHAEEAAAIIQELMEDPLPFKLRVPLVAEPEIADSWGEAK